MAAYEWDDWFEREEFIGQISDMRVQNLQVQREVVQKRTFTRWMNLHLKKCNPPIEVQDLFQDIQDGRILMALLEELSGCKLLHGLKKSSHRIFRLNNIAKVLSFLEERNVKLISIDAADVVDGNSSIILGLIWNIILFFQIKELTSNLRSQFSSTSSFSSIPTSTHRSNCNTSMAVGQMVTTTTEEHSRQFKKLLQWAQKQTRRYGIAIQDFGKSWTSGLGFLAIIKSIDSSLVDMRKALMRNARENLEDAFRIAHYSLGIPCLLEPKDVTISAPDEHSIMTYVAQFLEHFPAIEEQKERYPLIKRSISMGRLCNLDTQHLGNSVHSSRVRERRIMFQMDCAQPPPQILFSCVSENRGCLPLSIQPAMSRIWFSEDLLPHSTRLEDNLRSAEENAKESTEEITTNLTSNSLQLTHSNSLFDSMLPKLVKTESVMGDSAISFPDSWVESKDGVVPVKCCESQSDSATHCEMDCATHVDITCSDGVPVPVKHEVPDGQSVSESYTVEDFSQASDFVEPMDLFCPYKGEALFPEPHDKMQSCPSVLSVTALEQAPASETVPEDQPLYLMDEDFVKFLKDDKVMTDIKYKTFSTSEPKKQCQGHVGQIKGFIGSVFPPDCSGLSETQQDRQGSSETMRWRESWEPYLLLVLWLLLYCLWLLPQMELKTLPNLLFNINY
ncbi:calmin-like isoform X11 [Syngnathoides biaculeatus]|uniref:calmin-like isoform X11 n=1 Tax=Syngnathoides biaculeatus TaxID=300417 RepID=UPI002ADE6F41|nr:calmin-like isoform X11 [Syngnathoides biaculeatus]